MARGLTSAVKTELATQRIRPIYLIDIGFPTPIFLTNCSFPITSYVSGSSQTYSNSSHLLQITNVVESNLPVRNSLKVVLSGVDQTFISIVLGTSVIGDVVRIYRGFLDDSNDVIADPFLLYYGTIDEYDVVDNTSECKISLIVTSHWGQFDKIGGRTTSNNSQQKFFSGDKGMEFAALSISDIKWGKEV